VTGSAHFDRRAYIYIQTNVYNKLDIMSVNALSNCPHIQGINLLQFTNVYCVILFTYQVKSLVYRK